MSLLRAVRGVADPARYAVLALCLLALLLGSGSARAQTSSLPAVTGIVPPVSRYEVGGAPADDTGEHPHPAGIADNVINYEDCEANLSFQFTLTLGGVLTGDNLVAWVGPGDCTALAARVGSTATCWPVEAGPISQGSPTDAGAITTTFAVRMQDIVAQAASASGTIDPTYPSGGGATDAVCTRQTNDAEVPLFLWFFFTDGDNLGEGGIGGGDGIGVGQVYPLFVDTYAQDLSGGVKVNQSLDSQLTVTITASPDSDTVSYNIYCDPPPGEKPLPYDASYIESITSDAAFYNQCVADASGKDAFTEPSDSAPLDAPAESSTSSAKDASDDASADASDDASRDASDDAAKNSSEDSSVADSASDDSGILPSPPDDAGGNRCGIPVNEAGATTVGQLACPPSYLVSSVSGTPSAVPVEDGGSSEAGEATPADAGASTRGTMLLAIPPKYLCGTATLASPNLTITGLHDGYTYTIAAAAVDVAGNIGPLAVGGSAADGGSNFCTTVSEIPDFWSNYLQAGGQAGGGFCSAADGIGLPAGTSGLGLLMIASIVAVTRRRRRR